MRWDKVVYDRTILFVSNLGQRVLGYVVHDGLRIPYTGATATSVGKNDVVTYVAAPHIAHDVLVQHDPMLRPGRVLGDRQETRTEIRRQAGRDRPGRVGDNRNRSQPRPH